MTHLQDIYRRAAANGLYLQVRPIQNGVVQMTLAADDRREGHVDHLTVLVPGRYSVEDAAAFLIGQMPVLLD